MLRRSIKRNDEEFSANISEGKGRASVDNEQGNEECP